MIRFNEDHIEMYLGVVRKYMQIRGGLSQKELAEQVDVGISTMSRFLNQKTKELDEQIIAKIVAVLNIPLHEIIDFIEEGSTQMFKKLILFYKEQAKPDAGYGIGMMNPTADDLSSTSRKVDTTERRTTAQVKVGGKSTSIPFGENHNRRNDDQSIRDKLQSLSPRQKGFLTDFLDIDEEGKDLVVDVSTALFRYFKQSRIEF